MLAPQKIKVQTVPSMKAEATLKRHIHLTADASLRGRMCLFVEVFASFHRGHGSGRAQQCLPSLHPAVCLWDGETKEALLGAVHRALYESKDSLQEVRFYPQTGVRREVNALFLGSVGLHFIEGKWSAAPNSAPSVSPSCGYTAAPTLTEIGGCSAFPRHTQWIRRATCCACSSSASGMIDRKTHRLRNEPLYWTLRQ